MSKILLIGPRFNQKDSKKIGGIVVLFEDLIQQFQKNNISFSIIDTNKNNYSNKIIAFISIYSQFLFLLFNHSHVSIHGTAKDYIFIAPMMVFISKLFNKKVSLRKFAGNFNEIYNKSNFLKRKLIKYILKNSDVNFFETKYLVKEFSTFNKNTFWFPNVRNDSLYKTSEKYNKKFIFVGNISKEKGIDTLLEVSNLLDNSFIIDLYGNLKDYQEKDFENFNVKYKGTLKSDSVFEKMSEYDVLILPSLREGYPGVIIEAFSVGLPVIATKLAGISEMVNDNCAILIEKKDIKNLVNAINYFNNDNYREKRTYAIEQFNQFNSEKQTKLFLERIEY